jgi:hypothetical protein
MFAAPSRYVGSQRCLTAASSIVKRTGGPEVPGTFDAAGRYLSFVAARGSTLAGKLCRLSVNSIPELIRCHLDDSVLEQNVILRQYRQTVENRILASYFWACWKNWRTRQYSKFLGGMYTSGKSRISGSSSGSREFESFDSISQVFLYTHESQDFPDTCRKIAQIVVFDFRPGINFECFAHSGYRPPVLLGHV